MLEGSLPWKKCFNADSISPGKIETAPKAIAHNSMVTSNTISIGKNNLFFLSIWGGMKQVH